MLRKLSVGDSVAAVFFCFGLVLFYLYDYQLRLLPDLLDNAITYVYHLSAYGYASLHSLYYLIYVPMQLLVGVLVDRYAPARLMAAALLFACFGCYLFANAYWFWLAEIGRLLMGLGASFIFVSSLKLISLRLPACRFGFYLGIIVCAAISALLVSDMMMVLLLQHWGWRLVCYVLAISGVLLALTHYFYFSCARIKSQSVTQRTSFYHDMRQLLAYLKNRQLIIHCLIGLLLYMPVVCFAEVWGGRFLFHSYQFSALANTVDISLLFSGFAIGAPLLGWLYDKTSESQLILMLGSVGATVMLSVILCVPDLSATKMGLFLGLLGFFSSSVMVVLALNRRLVADSHLGKLFGVSNAFIMLSGICAFLVSILLHAIEKNSLLKLLPFYASSSYQLALLFLPCGTLLAVFLTLYVRQESIQ